MKNILDKIKEKLTKKSFKKLNLIEDKPFYIELAKFIKTELINEEEFNIVINKEAFYVLNIADQLYKFYDSPNLIVGLFTDVAYNKIFDMLKSFELINSNERYDIIEFNEKYLDKIFVEDENDDNYYCVVKNQKNKDKYVFKFEKLIDNGESLVYKCKLVNVE